MMAAAVDKLSFSHTHTHTHTLSLSLSLCVRVCPPFVLAAKTLQLHLYEHVVGDKRTELTALLNHATQVGT
jgi:hypothetical protein